MSDTTGLKVFDPEGMYRQLSDIVTDTQQHPDKSSVCAKGEGDGCASVSFIASGHAWAQDTPTPGHEQAQSEPLPFATLDELETMLDAHPAGLTKAYAQWLVRVCRASDARVIDLENQLKTKQADFNGMISEWHDLADENRRLKQQAEVDKLVCESQERTVIELRAQVESLSRSDAITA